jgi:hypothetical protein
MQYVARRLGKSPSVGLIALSYGCYDDGALDSCKIRYYNGKGWTNRQPAPASCVCPMKIFLIILSSRRPSLFFSLSLSLPLPVDPVLPLPF